MFPRAGWVEMDALEIVRSVERCIEETCNNLKQDGSKGEIRAVGISNQRGRGIRRGCYTGYSREK